MLADQADRARVSVWTNDYNGPLRVAVAIDTRGAGLLPELPELPV